MVYKNLFWRGMAMAFLVMLAVITAYPAVFIVTHGFDASTWPQFLDGPDAWFRSLGHADFNMLFKIYAEMATGKCDAIAGGGFVEIVLLVIGLIVATPFVVLGGGTTVRRSSSNEYGSTDWATKSDIGRLNKGLEIGIDPTTKRRVRIQVEGNLLTIAPPRTGKTAGFIIPNLAFPEKNAWSGPAVVIDPKGDAYKAVKRRREAMGRTVRCLDPLGMRGGQDRWNALANVDVTDVLRMLSVARALLPSEAKDENGDYFTNTAADLIVGAMICAANRGRADPVGAAALLNDRSEFRKALEKNSDDASATALAILNMDDRGRDAIESTARQATQWLRDERMKTIVQNPTFEMADLLSGDVDLFIVLPADEKKKIIAPFVRWLLSDLFAAVRSRPPEQRIVAFIDEANVLGNFDALLEGYGELPGYGISLWTIWQARSQIVKTYGKEGAETLLGTAEMTNIFGLPRVLPDEQEYWSTAIGSFTGFKETSSISETSKEKSKTTALESLRLVPATDLPELLRLWQVVFLNKGNRTTNPMKLARTQAHNDLRFVGLLDGKQPVGQTK
jgi:type IV secretion system protein VirD4